ncbi:MAG TPA: TetR/AcrR family transcriptional regulator [Polyangia bacterium]|nr:TetR/AcrR family transcriptional regulator [Polyangia bacterium]
MPARTATLARDGRSVRAEKLREKRRRQILGCARRLFAQDGYHATSVADIILAAGVARGTFYLHFPSKRAVFDQLIDGLFGRLNATVHRIEVGPSAPPPLEQMRANVLGVVTLLLSERDLTRILLREAGADPDFDRKLLDFYGRLLGRIEDGVRLGQTMGLLRACEPRVAAACVLGSIKEVMYRYAVAGETPPEPTRLSNEILDYVVQALFRPLRQKES